MFDDLPSFSRCTLASWLLVLCYGGGDITSASTRPFLPSRSRPSSASRFLPVSLQPQMSSLCRHFSSPCSPSRSCFRLNSSSAGLERISGFLRLGAPSLRVQRKRRFAPPSPPRSPPSSNSKGFLFEDANHAPFCRPARSGPPSCRPLRRARTQGCAVRRRRHQGCQVLTEAPQGRKVW